MMVVYQAKHGDKIMTHLDALELRLSNERIRFSNASSSNEKATRKAWITQVEKEIKCEKEFLGIADEADITDDELLATLGL
jgi:hypothetical protein